MSPLTALCQGKVKPVGCIALGSTLQPVMFIFIAVARIATKYAIMDHSYKSILYTTLYSHHTLVYLHKKTIYTAGIV